MARGERGDGNGMLLAIRAASVVSLFCIETLSRMKTAVAGEAQ